MMRKRLVGLLILAVACTLVFAAVTTKPQSFTDVSDRRILSRTATQAMTVPFTWVSAPYASLSWNAYGDSGFVYFVGLQWADGSGHFDARIDTVMACTTGTLVTADTVRTTARRYTEELSRVVSEFGRALFLRDTLTDTLLTIYIDSVALVVDQR